MLVISCGGDGPPTGGGDSDFSGEYALQKVDGEPLPRVELVDDATGDKLIATGGKLRVLTHGRLQVIHTFEWHTVLSGVQPIRPDTVTKPYTIEGQVALIDYTLFPKHTDTLLVNGTTLTFNTLFKSFYASPQLRVEVYQRP
jgi:hypothetical protein